MTVCPSRIPDLFDLGDKAQDSIELATLPLDGIVSREAVTNPGALTTRPIVFAGKKLVVNFDDEGRGRSQRAELPAGRDTGPSASALSTVSGCGG